MNIPIYVSKICVTDRKQDASFWIARSMLAIVPLWLMLGAANTSAQTGTDVSSSSTTTSPAPPPSNWSQFLEDNMQRSNPNETILGVNTVANLTEKWNAEFSVSCCESPGSSPAVVNGVIYFGVINGMTAMNTTTSASLWTFDTDGSVSSPAVANGVVYFSSTDSNVYAVSASTGAKLWSFSTGNEVTSSPAVVNGAVYFGSGDHKVYALNAGTGAKLWSFTTGGAVDSSPAVASGVVYVSSGDGHFYALNASTGTYRWSWPINAPSASPSVANGVVYIIADDGTLYALNASTGAKVWSEAMGNLANSPPAVANGVLYISADKLHALNAATGAQLWTFPIAGSAPVAANGVVYFGGDNLYALNASTGAQLWTFPLTGSLLVVADGMLFLHNAGGADPVSWEDGLEAFSLGADLFLRIFTTPKTVHQGDLLTYEFSVWNLGPVGADQEVLMTQVPTGTTFDYIRISGTPGLGTCTTPPYQTIGEIVCHQNGSMAPNTTWNVRLTVRVTAPAGAIIFENGATLAKITNDANTANNTASVRVTVQ
jgi:uncharacterized repeat protein (TIGR01451 family)